MKTLVDISFSGRNAKRRIKYCTNASLLECYLQQNIYRNVQQAGRLNATMNYIESLISGLNSSTALRYASAGGAETQKGKL
jgi:hypothetical protein